ncbi:MAG: membrane dipeptidase [Oscillospiraceae bacterium]|jgi:membrane dipeptidase|nr:membrane dipeptidase [Oscillospiraceae bacterium]
MRYIDLHCDTLTRALELGARDMLSLPEAMLDVRRLRAAGALGQVFAVYFPPRSELRRRFGMDDEAFFCACAKIYHNTFGRSRSPRGFAHFVSGRADPPAFFPVLSLEDGRILSGKPGNIARFRDLGVQLITLTWNEPNCLGFPCSSDARIMERGLTPFGIDAVWEMNRRGVAVDVSHLSDGGFWDVLRHSERPFLASHSNARAVHKHPRNLTDDMLRAIARRGGIVGLNFAPSISGTGGSEQLLRHARHILRVGGEDILALGSDLDGFQESSELCSARHIAALPEYFHGSGFSCDATEKLAYRNALRFFEDVCD